MVKSFAPAGGEGLNGVAHQIRQLRITIRPAEINGQPGARFLDPDGHLINVFVLDIADGQVRAVRSVINPQKLCHLGPLADVPNLPPPTPLTGAAACGKRRVVNFFAPCGAKKFTSNAYPQRWVAGPGVAVAERTTDAGAYAN